MRRRSAAAGEAWLALLGWCAVAVAFTWPALAHPATTIPADLGDPLLQAWQLAWGGHALLHQPLHPFDSNTFFPLPASLSFSDSLLGFAPVSWIGSGPTAALVRYNVVFAFSYALCGWGAYLLARQLGVRRAAALVAGAVMLAVPWRAAQAGHLQILSCGAVPLALALLARGHDVGRGRAGGTGGPRPAVAARRLRVARPSCALLGWLVAAWQISLGFGVGLQWGYLLGLVVLVAAGRWLLAGRPALGRRLLVADAVGAAVLLAVAVAFALPYLRAVRDHPDAKRTVADLALFSPPPRGFLVPPSTSVVWGDRLAGLRADLPFPPEMALGLGGATVVLAVLGLLAGRTWSWPRRLVLAGAVVVLLVLATGVQGPFGGRLYLLLFDHAPGFSGIRTPGRLVVTATVGLALLAAVGAQALLRPLTRALPRAAPLIGLLLAAVVVVEGAADLAHPRPAAPPLTALATGSGPLLVLPTDEASDETTMWWSTASFPLVANGTSGFVPEVTRRLRADAAQLPLAASVDALRGYGVRRVLVLLGRYDQTRQRLLLQGQLPAGVTRTPVPQDHAVVFQL